MQLIYCPQCGLLLPAGARACPRCGRPAPAPVPAAPRAAVHAAPHYTRAPQGLGYYQVRLGLRA